MAMVIEDKALELAKDVTVKIVWDSLMQKRFVLDKENLLDRAISHGIYIFFMEDMLTVQFSRNIETAIMVKFFAGLVGKSIMDVLVKIIRRRDFNYVDIIISNAMGEIVGIIWDNVISRVAIPSNGNVRMY